MAFNLEQDAPIAPSKILAVYISLYFFGNCVEVDEKDAFIFTNNANVVSIFLLEPLFNRILSLRVHALVLTYNLEDVILFV